MAKKYKVICWLIWSIGFIAIIVPSIFKERNVLISGLISSLPFAVLSMYAKVVFESDITSPYRKIKLAGILGAFAFTLLYAILDFHVYITGLFVFLGFATIIVGFIAGVLSYKLFLQVNSNRK